MRVAVVRTVILVGALSIFCRAAPSVDLNTLQKSIVFLFYSDSSGNPNTKKFATAFLIKIPKKALGQQDYTFLVTARHVVDPQWVKCSHLRDPEKIFIRVNAKTFDPKGSASGLEYLPLELRQDNKRLWYPHPDDTVDIAVIPLTASTKLQLSGKSWDLSDYDVEAIPFSWIATPVEMQTLGKMGTSIFAAELLTDLADARRNYSVLKFGKITGIFDELVEVPCPIKANSFKSFAMWSVSLNSDPSEYGSPVFWSSAEAVHTGTASSTTGRTALVGVIATTARGIDFSGMTPIQRLAELFQRINLDELESVPDADRPTTKP